MLKSAHAIPILLYALPLWYVFLTAAAGAFALGRRPLPSWFWTASRIGAVVVTLQALIGVAVFAGGARPGRALHLLYGLLTVLAAFTLTGLREGGWIRRLVVAADPASGASTSRTAALIALTQAALLLRAWMTGLARAL
jgi:hypothetical protein